MVPKTMGGHNDDFVFVGGQGGCRHDNVRASSDNTVGIRTTRGFQCVLIHFVLIVEEFHS